MTPRPEAANSAAARDARLADALFRLGRLNAEAIARVKSAQQRTNASFARAASALGLLTRDDLAAALGVLNGFVRERGGDGAIPPSLVAVRRPRSAEAEQFRALRARLLTGKEADRAGLFAIASTGAREADYVAVNLAAACAQFGRRVLLVDADLRATRLAAQFGLEAAPGLAEILRGEADLARAVRTSVVANLSVLTSGAPAPRAHDHLAAETLRAQFDACRRNFDIVMAVAAPFGVVLDAQFVWAATRSVFVVSRRHVDRLDGLAAMGAALRQVGADAIGAALVG
jgi:receptor protein-tyrosine kinase